MTKHMTVSATEANRSFSKLLRAVRAGQRVTILSHGEPVAELGPPSVEKDDREARMKALAELEAHWATLTPVVVGPWTRDELYERD